MKNKHLLRSIIAIVLCALMLGGAFAVGYSVYLNEQGKKVVIDKDNNLPVVKPGNGSVSAPVTTENGLTTSDVTLKTDNESILAVIPQGTKLNAGVNKVTLSVKEIENSQANVELEANEEKVSYDIHVEGVAEDNTAPIKVYVKEMLPVGLNMGNYKLYHVENGETVEMTLLGENEPVHNNFEYDEVTGDVTLYLASFSEVSVVADTTMAWEGNVATAFAGGSGTKDDPYIIANADQLAYFGKVVGGMGFVRNSFDDEYVKLVADINLADDEKNNVEGKIFHPIGYYFNENYDLGNGKTGVFSTVYSFEGTFDGNGHTIANFYHNTWEIKGDYNEGYPANSNYYKDAMGLFGYVLNGKIENLTVDSFSSDGEFTPTGVIAAFADGDSTFKNIAITNCNPRVYNTGNGGIIGIAGDTSAENDDHITLENITVDNTNKISALWGSWDVACGGLVGMYRGNVNGSGEATGDTISFTNCHVAAQIDVYNDVCANYQYYAYRYAGMIIGSIRHNTKNDAGRVIPNMAGISASGCTVNYGDWNSYYYCELVANTIASYTHDYQFSRLTQVQAINGTSITYLDGTTGTVPASGRYNYVVVEGNHAHENATCYHFVNGEAWTHDMANTEVVDGKEVLVENNQHIYLPFHQLFTGYSWGVSSIGLKEYSGIVTNLDIIEGDQNESVVKFDKLFTGDFLYRVGNGNAVSLSSLFKAATDATINSSGVWVTIENIDENSNASGTFTANTTDWTKATIQFSGTGVVKVTIQDYNYCTPTTLLLEVVDAKNATTAASATANNVVLLQDVSGSFSVSGGHSLYGNGFKVTLPTTSQSKYSAGFVGYVTIMGGNLDNVQIVGPTYPVANIYREQAKDSADETKANYFYNSVIITSGNCTISNSYISGSRSAVCIRGANNVIIENSTIEGGAAANIDIESAISVTLKDVNTVQKATPDSYGQNKNMIGMGVSVFSGTTKINLEGSLNQYNWVNESQWDSMVPSDYQSAFPKFFTSSTYEIYQVQYNEVTYVNLGFIFICDWDEDIINDNRTDNTLVYEKTAVTLSGKKGGVFTVAYLETLTDDLYNAPAYIPSKNNPVAPKFSFDNSVNNDDDDANDANDSYCTYDEGTLKIGLSGNSTTKPINLSGVSIQLNGVALDYTTYLNDTQVDGSSVNIDFASGTRQILTFKATVNSAGYDINGNEIAGTINYEWSIPVEIATLSYPAPEWNMSGDYQFDTSNCYYVYYSTSQGYGEAVPIYEGIKVKYYDKNGNEIVKDLSGTTTLPTGSNNSNGNSFTYTLDDGSILTMKFSSGWKSGATTHQFTAYNNRVYIYPQNLDNDGYIRAKVTNQDFNVKITYTFTDPNGQSTGAQTMQWYNAAASNGSVSTVQWKTFDSTNGKKASVCVTPDTLVTMADGTKKEIQNVTVGESVIAWNFYTGKYEAVPASLVQNHCTDYMNVLHLYFEDGTELKVLGEHGIYDYDLNTFIFIDMNDVENYMGHNFVKQDGEGFTTVKLIDYKVTYEYTSAYTILSTDHYNVILEGMFTVTPAHVGDNFFNPFDVDENMMYDEEAVKADIEKYGLYTYEEFAHVLTYEQFEALGIAEFKVSVGKGLVTYEGLIYLIENFVNKF